MRNTDDKFFQNIVRDLEAVEFLVRVIYYIYKVWETIVNPMTIMTEIAEQVIPSANSLVLSSLIFGTKSMIDTLSTLILKYFGNWKGKGVISIYR